MPTNPYNEHLDKNPANYQPLTPLQFLQRAALVFPNHTAIIHGNQRFTYAQFYERCRRLASGLIARAARHGRHGFGLMQPPPMLEAKRRAHVGAVMHTSHRLETRSSHSSSTTETRS